MDVLNVAGVEKWYGTYPGIVDATLTVAPGTICVLLGANGAGKTTLLNMIAAQSPPSKGEISLFEKPVWADPTGAKRVLGFVPDADNDLPDYLTGREYLLFIAAVHHLSAEAAGERIHSLLSRFDLVSAENRLIKGYSHGMKKKLQIAAALMHDPGLLVIDEPTNGLDPISVRILRDYLRSIATGTRAILLATHDLHFAQRLSDSIYIVARQRIVAAGSLPKLLQQFRCEDLEEVYIKACFPPAGDHPAGTSPSSGAL